MSLPTADPLGVWLLKWLVAPLSLVLIIGFAVHTELQKRRCQRLAAERGFQEASIVPGRHGASTQCHCRRLQRPDGTIDEQANLTIRLE